MLPRLSRIARPRRIIVLTAIAATVAITVGIIISAPRVTAVDAAVAGLLLVAGGLIGVGFATFGGAKPAHGAADADAYRDSARWRAVMLNVAYGVITIDTHGVIESINPAGETLFGYGADEIIGKNISVMMADEHRTLHDQYIQRFESTGARRVIGIDRNVLARRKDGTTFPIQLVINELRFDGKRYFSGIIRDVSLLKAQEAALALARDRAMEASRAKSMFLANMSHEIRTPLNGVVGMIELLKGTNPTPQQQDFLNVASRSADALLGIIRDILDFSKIEAGRIDLECVDFDLRELIEDVCSLHALAAQRKGLVLCCSVPSDARVALRGDPMRFAQIVGNLVGNAVKFTQHGSVAVRVTTRPSDDRYVAVRIEVSDTGIGVAPDQQLRLFAPFMQADDSATRKFGGTGLGLSISRRLAEMMSGSVRLEGTSPSGSTFVVDAVLEPQVNVIAAAREFASQRVLLAVANAVESDVLAELIGSFGLRVEPISCGGGIEARLRSALEGAPAPVVLDGTVLRDAGGAAGFPNTPIVLLTELTSATHGVDLESPGITAVTKPVKRHALLRALRTALSRRAVPGERVAPPQAVADALPFANRRILVVEDNEVNRLVAVGFLRKYGCEVVTVANGVEALSAMSRQSFDLVLMDIQMPELDGYEATAQIRVRERHEGRARVPIIAFTANAMSSDPEKCLAAGMDDYLPKPIEPKRLEDALRRWIGDARAQPVHAARGVAPQPDAGTVIDARVVDNLKRAVGPAVAVIVGAYQSEAPEAITKMRDALRRGDRETLRREAHSLKSASATVGASAVETAARELEIRAGDADIETIQTLLNGIEPRVSAAVAALGRIQINAAVVTS